MLYKSLRKFDKLFIILTFCASLSVSGCGGSGQTLPSEEEVPPDPAVTEGDPAAVEGAETETAP